MSPEAQPMSEMTVVHGQDATYDVFVVNIDDMGVDAAILATTLGCPRTNSAMCSVFDNRRRLGSGLWCSDRC